MRRDTYACGERMGRSQSRRPGRSRMARQHFARWLDTARPGDTYIYHSGHLLVDRSSQIYTCGLARDAMTAYVVGTVLLTQRRHGPGVYDYIATRR